MNVLVVHVKMVEHVLKESIYIIVHVNQVIQDNSVKWVSVYMCQGFPINLVYSHLVK